MLAAVLAALTGLSLAAGHAAPARAAPGRFLVVVDAGHGGDQDGAVSPKGLKEKDLTLQLAQQLGARLRKDGVKVVLTRVGDQPVPIANRPMIANAIHADLFVSIHLNSMATAEARERMTGVETYFMSADASDARASAVAERENADRLADAPGVDPADPVATILGDLADAHSLAGGSRLAYAIHDRLVAALGAQDHGVRQAPFYVLAGAQMPAVLLEVGFISHPLESERLATRDYQQKAVEAIAQGIAAFRQQVRRAAR
jgi:N-acetylmuramoyl-L-alanine amidase